MNTISFIVRLGVLIGCGHGFFVFRGSGVKSQSARGVGTNADVQAIVESPVEWMDDYIMQAVARAREAARAESALRIAELEAELAMLRGARQEAKPVPLAALEEAKEEPKDSQGNQLTPEEIEETVFNVNAPLAPSILADGRRLVDCEGLKAQLPSAFLPGPIVPKPPPLPKMHPSYSAKLKDPDFLLSQARWGQEEIERLKREHNLPASTERSSSIALPVHEQEAAADQKQSFFRAAAASSDESAKSKPANGVSQDGLVAV